MSTQSKPPKLIFRGATWCYVRPEKTQEIFDVLVRYNAFGLDMAHIYEGSDKSLGEYDTKAPEFQPGCPSRDSIFKAAEKSLEEQRTEYVETFILAPPTHPPLHHPYLDHPEEDSIEETLDGIQKLFQSGRFKRFGLSNYDAWEVRTIYNYASSKGYFLPSIFQGHFNAVSRQYEKTLFPLLRELNISFYADFPTAGLVLTDTLGTGSTLWDPSTRFGGDKIYNIPGLLKALPEWQNIAEEAGMSKEALAYRWVAYNSILSSEHGDALMIQASQLKSLELVLEMLAQGPLDSSIAEKIDHVWETIEWYRY